MKKSKRWLIVSGIVGLMFMLGACGDEDKTDTVEETENSFKPATNVTIGVSRDTFIKDITELMGEVSEVEAVESDSGKEYVYSFEDEKFGESRLLLTANEKDEVAYINIQAVSTVDTSKEVVDTYTNLLLGFIGKYDKGVTQDKITGEIKEVEEEGKDKSLIGSRVYKGKERVYMLNAVRVDTNHLTTLEIFSAEDESIANIK